MLSDEELAEARALLYDDEGVGDLGARLTSEWAAIRYNTTVNVSGRKLLAEIERLRAENAAMRTALQSVVDRNPMRRTDCSGYRVCDYCYADEGEPHVFGCQWVATRALLEKLGDESHE